jgi:hypothetical protein
VSVSFAQYSPAGTTHYYGAACLGGDGLVWMTSWTSGPGTFVATQVTRVDSLGIPPTATVTNFTLGYVACAYNLVRMGGYLWTVAQSGTVGYLLRIDTSGTVTAYSLGAGTGTLYSPVDAQPGMVVGPDGNFWVVAVDGSTPALLRITPTGTLTAFTLGGATHMQGVASDGTNLWVSFNQASGNLVEIDTTGTILNTYTLSPQPTSGIAIAGGYIFGFDGLTGGFTHDTIMWWAPLSSPTTVTTYTLSAPCIWQGGFDDGVGNLWLGCNTTGLSDGDLMQVALPPTITTVTEYNNYGGGSPYGGTSGVLPGVPCLDAFGNLYVPDFFTGSVFAAAYVASPPQGLVMLP